MHVKFDGQTYETIGGPRTDSSGDRYINLDDGGNPRRVPYALVTEVPALIVAPLLEAGQVLLDEAAALSNGIPKVSKATGYHVVGLPDILDHKHFVRARGTCRCEDQE